MPAPRCYALVTRAVSLTLLLLTSASLVAAQVPTSQPAQTPRTPQQPPPRTSSDTSPVEVSIEGCVTRATRQDTGTGAPVFMLTDASMPERDTTVPRTPVDERLAAAEPKTPDTTPTSLVVRLDAGPELKLESHVSHRITARGTLSDEPSAGRDGKAAPRTLKVTSIEMVAATCVKP